MEEKGIYAIPSLVMFGFVTVFSTGILLLVLVITLVLFGS